MSQENVKIVQAGLAAWNAGDMDAIRERYDPNVIIVRGLEGWPEPAPVVGRDAVVGQFERVREAFDTDTVEPVSFIDAADRVVVRQLWSGAGHGPESKMEFTVIYTLRKGKVFLVEYFWDHAEALEALGLS